MTLPSPVEATFGAGRFIGRYFSLISAFPSAIFILYVAALLWGGGGSGSFSPARAVETAQALDWKDFVWLVVLAVLLGVVVHPLQFALTQILEGYWGAGSFGTWLSAVATLRHRARALRLDRREDEATTTWLRGAHQLIASSSRAKFAKMAEDKQRNLAEKTLNSDGA